MPTGKVKFYDLSKEKEFGVIVPDDGSQDVFVHLRELKESGLDCLVEHQKVSYDLKEVKNKIMAHNIRLLMP